MCKSLQSLVYDSGIIIHCPDPSQKSPNTLQLKERGLGKHIWDVLLNKPGAVRGDQRKQMLYYRTCFGGETVDVGWLGISTTHLQGGCVPPASPSGKAWALQPGVKRWERWDIQEAVLQRPLPEELSSLFRTGKVAGTHHS